MKKLPWKTVIVASVAIIALASVIIYEVRRSERAAESLVVASPVGTVASSTGTVATSTPRKGLDFVLKDASIESIPDPRSGSYSFKLDGVTIGIIVLTPGGNGSKVPESFATWYAGLEDTVKLDGKDVSIEKSKIGGRDAISFKVTTDGKTAENVMTEVDGYVLWLQVQASKDHLVRFLDNLEAIKAN